MKNKHLADVVNDGTRKISIRGNQTLVPLKFDKRGNPATDSTRILKRLNLDDLRFLQVWRELEWDVVEATKVIGLPPERVAKLVKKLQCFRNEDAQVKALAEIPTPNWIAAKHVENVYNGGSLDESEHKSLQELAKIEGAYKQQAPSTQINIWNLPDLAPEQNAKLKEVFDAVAMENPDVAA